MSWDARAEAYRTSPTHRAGADLDALVEWCEPARGVVALDVATGGGHVGRRLAEAGCRVTTADASPGMQPDVVCPAESLPFEDRSFDVVACRIAAHHFDDVAAAVREMARVTRRLVVIEDTLYADEQVELFPKRHPLEPWLERCGCTGEAAERVRQLLAGRLDEDGSVWLDTKILLRASRG
jgi:SAM-dependent methyltransferase